jgi:hypothetical protein
MNGRSAQPDPQGHHDDLDPQDAARLTLLVPDDASALEADRLAWLAELADLDAGRAGSPGGPAEGHHTLTMRQRRRALVSPRPRRRLAILAGITACAVLAMSLLGATMALFSPGARPLVTPQTPLAVGSADPGSLDGLLPAATLTSDTGSVASTDLRPGVVALVPATCTDCTQQLANVAAQAAEYRLPLFLVGGPSQHAQLQTLASGLAGRSVQALVDRNLTLRDTFAPAAFGLDHLLLLLVRADGTLYTVVNDPAADMRLEPSLVHLDTTTSGTSGTSTGP